MITVWILLNVIVNRQSQSNFQLEFKTSQECQRAANFIDKSFYGSNSICIEVRK